MEQLILSDAAEKQDQAAKTFFAECRIIEDRIKEELAWTKVDVASNSWSTYNNLQHRVTWFVDIVLFSPITKRCVSIQIKCNGVISFFFYDRTREYKNALEIVKDKSFKRMAPIPPRRDDTQIMKFPQRIGLCAQFLM